MLWIVELTCACRCDSSSGRPSRILCDARLRKGLHVHCLSCGQLLLARLELANLTCQVLHSRVRWAH